MPFRINGNFKRSRTDDTVNRLLVVKLEGETVEKQSSTMTNNYVYKENNLHCLILYGEQVQTICATTTNWMYQLMSRNCSSLKRLIRMFCSFTINFWCQILQWIHFQSICQCLEVKPKLVFVTRFLSNSSETPNRYENCCRDTTNALLFDKFFFRLWIHIRWSFQKLSTDASIIPTRFCLTGIEKQQQNYYSHRLANIISANCILQ